jgi:tetratricopeptide (TPR) repeat protein
VAGTARPLRPAGWRAGDAAPRIKHALKLIRDGKSAEALAAVRQELQANPNSSPAASLLDVLGATAEARKFFQKRIDAAPDAAAKAVAQRAMAMSYAFDGDSANTVKYEQQVMAYWETREQAEPQNAFYQQGEMANEAARVCIDAGELDAAERWYRRGAELGCASPSPGRTRRACGISGSLMPSGGSRRAAATPRRRIARSRLPAGCSTAIRKWPSNRSGFSRIWSVMWRSTRTI